MVARRIQHSGLTVPTRTRSFCQLDQVGVSSYFKNGGLRQKDFFNKNVVKRVDNIKKLLRWQIISK